MGNLFLKLPRLAQSLGFDNSKLRSRIVPYPCPYPSWGESVRVINFSAKAVLIRVEFLIPVTAFGIVQVLDKILDRVSKFERTVNTSIGYSAQL